MLAGIIKIRSARYSLDFSLFQAIHIHMDTIYNPRSAPIRGIRVAVIVPSFKKPLWPNSMILYQNLLQESFNVSSDECKTRRSRR